MTMTKEDMNLVGESGLKPALEEGDEECDRGTDDDIKTHHDAHCGQYKIRPGHHFQAPDEQFIYRRERP